MESANLTASLRHADALFLAAFIAFQPASAAPRKLSLEHVRACDRLIETAVAQRLAIENTFGKYHCMPSSQQRPFFILQLHYIGGEPDGWIGSTLVGYYAVRKSDFAVLDWDLGNHVPGEIISRQSP